MAVAAPLGSDDLLAQVALGPVARAALDRGTTTAAGELRGRFLARGRLAAALAGC